MLPAPRDLPYIAGDVRAATRVLEDVVDSLALDVWKSEAFAETDAIVTALHRLLCELRPRKQRGGE